MLKSNSAFIFLFSGLLALAGPLSCGQTASEQKASYGTRVKYQAGQEIEFPDFRVEYVGERRTSLPAYPRGFLYYDFKVRTANIEKVVSWSTARAISRQWSSRSAANGFFSSYAAPTNSGN